MDEVYVQAIRSGQTNFFKFVGQDQATIGQLLGELGVTDIQFIDQTTYEGGVKAAAAGYAS